MKNRKLKYLVILLLIGVAIAAFVFYSTRPKGPKPGTVLDEARRANRPASDFKAADEDYFHDMDQDKNGVVTLTAEEVKGRNSWVVWTGGNDRLWDILTVKSFGALDLLKTLSSYPNAISEKPDDKMYFSRDNRWHYLGLI